MLTKIILEQLEVKIKEGPISIVNSNCLKPFDCEIFNDSAVFLSYSGFSQKDNGFGQSTFRIDSLPPNGVLLDKGWKWHAGDNPDWATTDFDDTKWEPINPAQDIHDLPQVRKAQIGWLRLRLHVDSSIVRQSPVLILSQLGASEIYLNGKLIHRYGTVSSKGSVERTNFLRIHLASLGFNDQPNQVIAVRYSFTVDNFYFKYFYSNPCLELKLQPTDDAYADLRAVIQFQRTQQSLLAGFFLLLAAFSLFLYFLISVEKFYLFLGIFCLSQFWQVLSQVLFSTDVTTTGAFIFLFSGNIIALVGALMLLNGFYLLFSQPKRLFFYFLAGFAFVTIPCLLFLYSRGSTITFCFFLVLNMDILRLSFGAARRHRPGAWTLISTFLLFYLFFGVFIILNAIGQIQVGYLISAISLFVPLLGMSLFLAGEFSGTNHILIAKLIEVETLSTEKQRILAVQNETLERQVTERTAALYQSLETLKSTQNQLIQKEKPASLGELTAGIAHEIQNPLNFVNNFSEVSVDLVTELEQEQQKQLVPLN